MDDCTKRCYRSKKDARIANRHAGFRLKAYYCRQCRAWHVTALEKVRGMPKKLGLDD